jgi:transcriptional regulator with XRE-family HTH domain
MADYLGVARNTVSTWINGRIAPSKQTLRLWALRTGVDYEWLTAELDPSPRGGAKVQVSAGSASTRKCTPVHAGLLTVLCAA